MDIIKISDNFEKRFCRKCEKLFFAGMPLTVLEGANQVLSAALSVGGCAAIAGRRDGRINIQFDDNKKYISSNVLDIDYHKEEPVLDFFLRIKERGARLCGADIMLLYNTGIYAEYEALLLSSMYCFCKNMPAPHEIKSCLENPARDFVSTVGTRDTLLLHGERQGYIKFCDSSSKIVICRINGKNRVEKCADKEVLYAANLLAGGDYGAFGEAVTREYLENIKSGGIARKTRYLFETAVRLKDAFGYGISEDGGIFAFVENKKVNAFIQNLKKEYETYYGASPDFYVTRTENSGIKKGF